MGNMDLPLDLTEREASGRVHKISMQMLDWRRHASDEEAYDVFSDSGKVFMMIYYFDAEVTNGLLHQWIANPTGMYMPETRDAFVKIGAPEVAALISDAMALFPDGVPSRDYNERRRQLGALKAHEQERLEQMSGVYDDIRRDVLIKLLEYCRNNPEVTTLSRR